MSDTQVVTKSDTPASPSGLKWDVSKTSAIGPGLITAQTGVPAHFTIYFGEYSALKRNPDDDPRDCLDFQFEGPSAPGPLTCSSNVADGSVDVLYTPLLRGKYKLSVTLYGQHIPGSPFEVPVDGESIRAYGLSMRVKVSFFLEQKGIIKVGQEHKVSIDVGDKNIGGGLRVAMAGPKNAKVNLKMTGDSPKFDVTFRPSHPGAYLLYVKMAEENVPGSPFALKAK